VSPRQTQTNKEDLIEGKRTMTVRIDLGSVDFGEKESVLAEAAGFSISVFRYSTGVPAIRVKNTRGEIIVLPYQGHQIWRAIFDGRDLTMKSMFEEPVATRNYLETYGGFMIHCGFSRMGVPGAGDNHVLHGELPNAPYQNGWIEIDEAKNSCTVSGSYQYTVAFNTNYLATSSYALQADSALIDATLKVDNLKKTPMEYMYLAHANFRPVDNGELVYSASYSKEHVRVRKSIPSHVTPPPGFKELIERLGNEPDIHHKLSPDLAYDPEMVFFIDMNTDADGFAHTLLRHPDGGADYMRYLPRQAPICVRWICRTPDQDAIGIAFPSTAEPEGYSAEKAKGNVRTLAGGASWQVDMRMGALNKSEAEAAARQIEKINKA
jgi:hypothetical protein